MTMFDDELSQLRNGLRGYLPAGFRFQVGRRVRYEGLPQLLRAGRIIARKGTRGIYWYRVVWDKGGVSWMYEDDLSPEVDEKAD